mmetsp:Transcript_51091/g.91749  ORF Transcript_51091/g.91749 Transcript_51091/m.91749 type:complete len:733 (+) Transcript_51091:70-2268(+)
MGSGVTKKYKSEEDVDHNSWRKPKQTSRTGSKEKAVPGPSSTPSAAAVVNRAQASFSRAPASVQNDDDDDDLAEFANLADAANKVWDDLMVRRNDSKGGPQDMNALFGLAELKDAIERSAKRVDALRRKADQLLAKLDDKKAALDDLGSKFEERAPATPSGQWKLGDLALRRGKGFCELSMVHHEVDPPFFEVRMLTTGTVVGTEAEKLLALSLPQQSTAKAAIKDYEQVKLGLAQTEEEVQTAEQELRQQHQSLTEQVESKISSTKPSQPSRAAPPGLPDFEYLQKAASTPQAAKVEPTPASYPDMKGVKEDLRGLGVPREGNGNREERTTEEARNTATPGGAGARQVHSGPAGFPSFDDLQRMDKEASERKEKEKARTSNYPTPHATREVFTRPQAAAPGPTSQNTAQEQEAPRAAEKPFVPAGMPGIPTASGPGGGSSRASVLQQQRDQQEAFLQKQEAERQRQEAQRQQQEAQREEAERQESQRQARAQAQAQAAQDQAHPQPQQPQQPQTDWVVYRAQTGQFYYHNERTNQTAWNLPPGATCREPGAGPKQEGRAQGEKDDPFANLRQQEEENRKQREAYSQWYAQYSQWYNEQAAAGGAQTHTDGSMPGADRQGASAGAGSGKAGSQSGSAGQSLPPRGPAPPKLDAAFEDHAVYQIKSSVLKEMESMVNQGMEVSKRKKALRCLQIRWHPDKNPDKVEVSNSVFQFIEETKPWFLHDPDGEDKAG